VKQEFTSAKVMPLADDLCQGGNAKAEEPEGLLAMRS